MEVRHDGVPDDYGVTDDRTDDTNPPSLPPEPNLPCIHSIPSDEIKALIEEVNEEFLFWHPHRDKEDDSAPVIHTDILSTGDVSSNLNAAAAAAATDDDDGI